MKLKMTTCYNNDDCNSDSLCGNNNLCYIKPTFPMKGTLILVAIVFVYVISAGLLRKYFIKRNLFNIKIVSIIIIVGLLVLLSVGGTLYYTKSVKPYLTLASQGCTSGNFIRNGQCIICPEGTAFDRTTLNCKLLPVTCGLTTCSDGQVCVGKNGDRCCDSNYACNETCCPSGTTCIDSQNSKCGINCSVAGQVPCGGVCCDSNNCINDICCNGTVYKDPVSGESKCCETLVCGNSCCNQNQKCVTSTTTGEQVCGQICGNDVCDTENQNCIEINGIAYGCGTKNPMYNPPEYLPATVDNKAICNFNVSGTVSKPLWCNPNGGSSNRLLTFKCGNIGKCTKANCIDQLSKTICGSYIVNYIDQIEHDETTGTCKLTLSCNKNDLLKECPNISNNAYLSDCNDPSLTCPDGIICCQNNTTFDYLNKNYKTGNYTGTFFNQNNGYCYNDNLYKCPLYSFISNGNCIPLTNYNDPSSLLGKFPSMSSISSFGTGSVVFVNIGMLLITNKFYALNYDPTIQQTTLTDVSNYITKNENSPTGFICNPNVSDKLTIANKIIMVTSQNLPSSSTLSYSLETQTYNNTFLITTNFNNAIPSNAYQDPSSTTYALFSEKRDSTNPPIGNSNDTTNQNNPRYWFSFDSNGRLLNYYNLNDMGGSPILPINGIYLESFYNKSNNNIFVAPLSTSSFSITSIIDNLFILKDDGLGSLYSNIWLPIPCVW